MISVEFQLEHPLLREALQEVPDLELTWIRNVSADGPRLMLFWAEDHDFEAFERGLEADPTVELSQQIAEGDQRLYQVEIREAGAKMDLFPILVDTASVVDTATVTTDGWDCHVVFSDQTALDSFFEACRERGIQYTIERIHPGYDPGSDASALTDEQREALSTAAEFGYFDIPRQTSLTEIGDELGITDTAAGNRIRRGIKKLIQQSL